MRRGVGWLEGRGWGMVGTVAMGLKNAVVDGLVA